MPAIVPSTTIVEALSGKWSRSRGMCCCPAHADRTPSLSITLGQRAILVHCFAGCTNEAVLQGMAKLGVRISDLFDGAGGPIATKPRHEIADRNALRLWLEASPLAGSSAARYLSARGITVASCELRFHPRMPLGPKGSVQFLPAMVAAVRNDAGILALHRTFLNPDGDGLAKFEQPKRALGSLGAGAVRLAFPRTARLGLAEGAESALSAMQLFGTPCWATLGNERSHVHSPRSRLALCRATPCSLGRACPCSPVYPIRGHHAWAIIHANLREALEATRIVDGETGGKARGTLMLKRSLVNGAQRLELTGWSASRIDWYKAQGCFTDIIRFQTRLFVPLEGAAEVVASIERH